MSGDLRAANAPHLPPANAAGTRAKPRAGGEPAEAGFSSLLRGLRHPPPEAREPSKPPAAHAARPDSAGKQPDEAAPAAESVAEPIVTLPALPHWQDWRPAGGHAPRDVRVEKQAEDDAPANRIPVQAGGRRVPGLPPESPWRAVAAPAGGPDAAAILPADELPALPKAVRPESAVPTLKEPHLARPLAEAGAVVVKQERYLAPAPRTAGPMPGEAVAPAVPLAASGDPGAEPAAARAGRSPAKDDGDPPRRERAAEAPAVVTVQKEASGFPLAGAASASPSPVQQVARAIAADMPPSMPAAAVDAARSGEPAKLIRLALDPLDLGTVEVQLRHSSAGVEVVIEAARADTAVQLERDRHLLRKVLDASGVRVEAVAVRHPDAVPAAVPADASAAQTGGQAGGQPGSAIAGGAGGSSERQPSHRPAVPGGPRHDDEAAGEARPADARRAHGGLWV